MPPSFFSLPSFFPFDPSLVLGRRRKRGGKIWLERLPPDLSRIISLALTLSPSHTLSLVCQQTTTLSPSHTLSLVCQQTTMGSCQQTTMGSWALWSVNKRLWVLGLSLFLTCPHKTDDRFSISLSHSLSLSRCRSLSLSRSLSCFLALRVFALIYQRCFLCL